MNRFLPSLAVLLSCAALVTAVFKRPASNNFSEGTPVDSLTGQSGIAELQEEIAQLKSANVALQSQIEALKRKPAAAGDRSPEVEALRQRVEKLEGVQGQVVEAVNEADKYGVVAAMEKELVTAYSTLMDTNQSAGARLKQIGQLKRYGYFDEKALRAVTEIYFATDDFNQKGFALSAMKGSVTPQFRDQILADLNADIEAGNKSARFRYHAIEALEPMADDPTVLQWLGHLAQNDPEPKLAARAGKALEVSQEARKE